MQWSEAHLSSSPSSTWGRGPTGPILRFLTCDMGAATLDSQDCRENSTYNIRLTAVQYEMSLSAMMLILSYQPNRTWKPGVTGVNFSSVKIWLCSLTGPFSISWLD